MSLALQLLTKTSTRILTLYPGADADIISATLDVVDLAQNYLGYEAISYTWGSGTAENTILVDNVEVRVTVNLHQCLKRLRSSVPRRLWCDYLCITQTDLHEKAHQVQIIGSIFACAKSVLIWLGEHANDSERLFHDWVEPRKPLRCWPLRSSKYQLWEAAYRVAATERAWQWLHFWQRPYWRRTWIIQELKLAQRIIVHVGSDAMDWKELISARFTDLGMYGRFDRLPSRGTPHRRSDLDEPLLLLAAHLSWQSRIVHVPVPSLIPDIRRRLTANVPFWLPKVVVVPSRRRQSKRPRLTGHRHQQLQRSARSDVDRLPRRENDSTSIFRLLGMFQHSFCSNPLDKVYALLSLESLSESAESELGMRPLIVDYTISLPELVLSILEHRFINLPPESTSRSNYRKFLLCVGFNDTTADKLMGWTTESPWPQRPPPFSQLLDTLDFEFEHCRMVADMAVEKSQMTTQPYARRWQQISEAIFTEFEKVNRRRELWISVKRRWDAGEVVVVRGSYTLAPSTDEDMYWHLVGKHRIQQGSHHTSAAIGSDSVVVN